MQQQSRVEQPFCGIFNHSSKLCCFRPSLHNITGILAIFTSFTSSSERRFCWRKQVKEPKGSFQSSDNVITPSHNIPEDACIDSCSHHENAYGEVCLCKAWNATQPTLPGPPLIIKLMLHHN